MDKTLQLVVVAAVILMAAAIIMFLLTGKTGGFGDFVGNKTQGASCTVNKTRYINACNCNASPPHEQPPAGSIRTGSQNQCDWATGGHKCRELCP